ncbi:leucine-rich repeat protein [bacterium]|nr:leucine-rich repeat protein [bacterium]
MAIQSWGFLAGLLWCLLSFNLSAASLEDLSYSVVGEEVHITRCSGEASGTLDIPSTIEGKPVTRLLFHSFRRCHKLEKVQIPDSVRAIEEAAFDHCTNLTEVTIGKGLELLEKWALNSDCDRLKNITVHPDNPHFSSLHGVLYNKSKTTLLVVPEATTGLLVIPESVTTIGLNALNGCRDIAEIIFKPLQAPAIEEVDGDPFWALSPEFNGNGIFQAAYIPQNAQGYDAIGYESLTIVTMDQNVEDTTPPTLKLLGSAMITLKAGETYMEPGVMVENAYDQANGYDLVTEGSINNAVPGDYTLTYTATDKAGNVANITRTVRVVDSTPPSLTPKGSAMLNHEVGKPYTDTGAKAEDKIDGSVEVTTSGKVDDTKLGTYTLTYTATDKAGNKASITRSVKVVDTTPPVITINGDSEVEVEVGQDYTDPGFKATDSFDDNLSLTTNLNTDPPISEWRIGSLVTIADNVYKWHYTDATYKFTYTAVDQSGNTATAYRVVKLTPDVTPPEITLIGEAWNDIYVVDEYTPDDPKTIDGFYKQLKDWAPGATAEDAVDGPIAVKILEDRNTQISINSERTFKVWHRDIWSAGLYAVVYQATDSSGNTAVAYRKVQVVQPGDDFYTEEELLTADFEPPVITLNGPSHVYVNLGASYEEQGATAEDAEDGAEEVTIGGSVNTSIMGVQEITYYAKDRFGNQSSATRYVIVIHPNARLLKFEINNDSVSVVDCSVSISGGLTIPSSWEGKPVTSIGNHAFRDCEFLESVTIPDSVTSIGSYAFYGCDHRSVTIGDSVTSIGANAFRDCEFLESVTIPDSVTSIGSGAFRDCEFLESVTIGDSVTSISNWAFYECQRLKSVTIPDSVTSIGSEAFRYCLQLTSVTIGDSVTSIGDGAFDHCVRLTSVTIPDSVTSIRSYTFSECSSLTSVTIPDSVTSIGYEAFSWCQQLKSVTFEGNAPTLREAVFLYSLRGGKVYVKANATGFGTTFGGLRVVREGSITTASKGNTSDGPIMDAVVFFDVNLNGLPDEGEPQTTSNGRGDYWLDIPMETYDLNGNGVIDISEGVIVSKGGTDTATGLSVRTTLKGPASATVITPLTTLVTRVMEQNPELDAGAAADKLEDSLGIPDGVDILSFDTFKEASEENPSAADVLTATAKLQDTLVQGGNLISGATGKSLQVGSDAVMDAIAQQVKAGNNVDLDSKDSLKGLVTEAASQSGANLTEAQTDGAASIMEASSKAKEDAKAAASTVTELATEVSRVQAVSQSKAAADLEAVGAQTAELESTVLAYTGAAMQQQVQTEVVGDFNASNREAPVFAFQSTSYTVNEDGQQQPVIQINRTGDSFEAVELTVTPIASSATAGEDFNGEPVSVSFEPLEIRKTLDLQTLLIDDVLAEEAETFSLQLAVVRDPEDPDLPELPEGEEDLSPDRPTVGTIGLAILTIISDDIANEAPTVSSIEDLEISEGAEQVSVDFSVTDTDSSFEELTVQASTSNPFLISGLVVEGTAGEQDASQWILNFATVADQFGEGTITVEINDGYQSVSRSFNVTVSAVNNAPQISGVPSVIQAEGRKVVVPFEVSDDQTSAGNLFIYLTAQPLDYILKGHVLVVGNGAQRELILNNNGNAEGTGQFSVVVTDADGKTASQAFEVNFGGEPPVAVVPELELNTNDPSNLTLSWEGDAQLLFTDDLSAGFEVVGGAKSPYTIEQGSMGFYILKTMP